MAAQSAWRHMRPTVIAGMLAIASGLAALQPLEAKKDKGPADAKDLLVVDCLLPPTIQRLGNNVTYLRARKGVKTSAWDCRRRGGEYTEAGEESFAQLLKIWLPAAEAGDAEAQTNLGEIFEKGRGGPAQPEIAAQWYRKAAEAGYSRAQVNLGSLYERGLGVPRDQSQAVAWYRRASGLGTAQTAAASTTAISKSFPGIERRTPARGSRIPKNVRFGSYHALVIGNNDYRYGPKLSMAVNDAQEVADVLRTKYGFRTTLLVNADRYQLLSAINRMREELTEKDNLLIYYAGHGTLDEVNDRGYWLPVDAELQSNANWIPSWQVTDLMNAMSAGQIMLVADSCFSGTLTTASIPTLDSGANEAETDQWYQKMATRHVRVVLTSGGVKPVLDGGGGQHSVFAAAFLEALRANTGVLEGQTLAQEVAGKVTVAARRMNFDQKPLYAPIRYAGHETGDFFFVARK